MNGREAIAILQNLIDNEYTMRDRDLNCTLCGNKVILTIPPTRDQHKDTCEIVRAKVALAILEGRDLDR